MRALQIAYSPLVLSVIGIRACGGVAVGPSIGAIESADISELFIDSTVTKHRFEDWNPGYERAEGDRVGPLSAASLPLLQGRYLQHRVQQEPLEPPVFYLECFEVLRSRRTGLL